MNISFYTPIESRTTSVGYGNAGFNMVTSLQSLGHKVPFDDAACPVQICFSNPYNYKFHEGQYKIGYTPWESTHVPAEWLVHMNQCDEIWATSSWVADVYRNGGVTVPVYVYEHGIDKQWQPIKRETTDVVKFLHIGEPALRKGGQMALDAFREAFGDRSDVHLTLKAYNQHYLRVWGEEGFAKVFNETYNNVSLITDDMPKPELMALYAEHDVMVYPSYGEGFGFLPLQALATGMPVISTGEWAPYQKFLKPLEIQGRWDRSIWSIHPGDVLYPDYNQLVKTYRFAADNVEWLHEHYSKQVPDIQADYDWLIKTEEAFSHIVERFTGN